MTTALPILTEDDVEDIVNATIADPAGEVEARVRLSGDAMDTGANLVFDDGNVLVQNGGHVRVDGGTSEQVAFQAGDGNTGMYGPSNNTLALVAGGLDILTVNRGAAPEVTMDFGTTEFLFQEGGSDVTFGVTNETGGDFLFEQVGSLGSAFFYLRKSLGTIASRLALGNFDKIGGFGFSANYGSETKRVGAEVSAYAKGAQTESNGGTDLRFSTTPEGQNFMETSMELWNNGVMKLPKYNGSGEASLLVDALGVVSRGNPIFGSEFQQEFSSGFSTQSTSYQTVIDRTIPAVIGGKYRLAISYIWCANSTSNDVQVRLRRSDTSEVLREHRQEPKDSSGSGSGGTDQRYTGAMVIYVDLAASTAPTFVFEFRTTNDDILASVFDTELEFWRVE